MLPCKRQTLKACHLRYTTNAAYWPIKNVWISVQITTVHVSRCLLAAIWNKYRLSDLWCNRMFFVMLHYIQRHSYTTEFEVRKIPPPLERIELYLNLCTALGPWGRFVVAYTDPAGKIACVIFEILNKTEKNSPLRPNSNKIFNAPRDRSGYIEKATNPKHQDQ